MIRPLRRRHLRMTLTLAVVVPVLYVAALLVRRPVPVAEALPPGLTSDAPAGAIPRLGSDDLFSAAEIRAVFYVSPPTVALEPLEELARPDVLVYWSSTEPRASASLPTDPVLLGLLGGAEPRFFRLPDQSLEEPGHLILFSLAHGEIVDHIAVPAPAVAGEGG